MNTDVSERPLQVLRLRCKGTLMHGRHKFQQCPMRSLAGKEYCIACYHPPPIAAWL